jgi:hypothetical protein
MRLLELPAENIHHLLTLVVQPLERPLLVPRVRVGGEQR